MKRTPTAKNPATAQGAYLEAALHQAGVTIKEASLATGRNHAYLHQYIYTGKPRYLPEQVRLQVERLYGVSGAPLRPPAMQQHADAGEKSDQMSVGDAEGAGQFIDNPELLQLIAAWRSIPQDRHALVFKILQSLSSDVTACEPTPRLA